MTIIATPPMSVALSEPMLEIRVMRMLMAKTGKMARRMTGARMIAPPVAGATPRPPWKPMNGRAAVADDGRQGRDDLGYRAAAYEHDQEHRHRTLGHVEQPGDERPAEADGSRHVRAARSAAPDGARIDAPDEPGDDDPEGNSADEVSGDDGEKDARYVCGLHRGEV